MVKREKHDAYAAAITHVSDAPSMPAMALPSTSGEALRLREWSAVGSPTQLSPGFAADGPDEKAALGSRCAGCPLRMRRLIGIDHVEGRYFVLGVVLGADEPFDDDVATAGHRRVVVVLNAPDNRPTNVGRGLATVWRPEPRRMTHADRLLRVALCRHGRSSAIPRNSPVSSWRC